MAPAKEDGQVTQASDLEGLSLLGKPAKPGKQLETVPNHHPDR